MTRSSSSCFPGYGDNKLRSLGAYWTAKEIGQQPDSWTNTQATVDTNRNGINRFLNKAMQSPETRIILTGAGTSAFAGACIAPFLSSVQDSRVEAIATTDIVSNPQQHLRSELPTLLVSFARSGNSPESVAALNLADDIVRNCFHLILTCNANGKLFERGTNSENCFALLMPPETNDRGFAMTSSFTSMVLAALTIFAEPKNVCSVVNSISASARQVIEQFNTRLKDLASMNFDRVVFLGSGGLTAIAQEAALKLLELTDGKTVAVHNSPLGFRHGPKTIVNNETLIVIFLSNDRYARKYDLDLLRELERDKNARLIVAVSATGGDLISSEQFQFENLQHIPDEFIFFPYAVLAQVFAFHCAINRHKKPDSPNVTGSVNRVVEGVTIYSYQHDQTY